MITLSMSKKISDTLETKYRKLVKQIMILKNDVVDEKGLRKMFLIYKKNIEKKLYKEYQLTIITIPTPNRQGKKIKKKANFFPGSVSGKELTRLPMQQTKETWVQSLGRKDPLEEGMATHSSIVAWRIT